MTRIHKSIISFKFALAGIWIALKEEHNLYAQLIIGIIGLLLGLYFKISRDDWLFGVISWGLVFSMELTNTAIEEVVDSFVSEYHPGAKKAKDVSAAAVMVAFFVEVIVGLIIFIPYILQFFKSP